MQKITEQCQVKTYSRLLRTSGLHLNKTIIQSLPSEKHRSGFRKDQISRVETVEPHFQYFRDIRAQYILLHNVVEKQSDKVRIQILKVKEENKLNFNRNNNKISVLRDQKR